MESLASTQPPADREEGSSSALATSAGAVDVHSAAIPVTFDGTVGLFTPARSNAAPVSAVLFLSPWGLEEYCTRKFWRILAEALAENGIPSLRFDYPGTGDALDVSSFQPGMRTWQDSVVAASSVLRELSGCGQTIVMSQGLGSILAADTASRLPDLAGIAFMAPVLSGRSHLRELSAWSKMIDEGLALTEAQRSQSGVSIAGLRMPDEIASDLRSRKLAELAARPAENCLVLERAGRPDDHAFADHLAHLGARVTTERFEGYDELLVNPYLQKMPMAIVPKIIAWAKAIPVDGKRSPANGIPRPASAEPLRGPGFMETPVRFGERDHLWGNLCEPIGERRGATVILLTTAYDRHAGWGRATVNMARELARNGIASLRFDSANVGDSPPVPGRSDEVLYDPAQGQEVGAALDFIEKRNLLPAVLAGRCSGAYLAFRSGLAEARCSGLAAVNTFVFAWNPTLSVGETIRLPPRSLEVYGQKIVRLETMRRLLRREIDLKNALPNLVIALTKRLSEPVRRSWQVRTPEAQAIYQAFRKLNADQKDVELIYSEHDIGRDQLDLYFGTYGKDLAAYSNVTLTFIQDADHNLTPASARAIFLDRVIALALKHPPKAPHP